MRKAGKTVRTTGAETPQQSDAAHRILRRAIIECDLPPGAEVSQASIERSFQLGKASLRSALTRLQQEGLIAPIARRGYIVSPITIKDIDDLFGLRMILEPAAARIAAGADQDSAIIKALREDAAVGFVFGDRESIRRHLRANRDFHVNIAKLSGNERLATVLEQTLDGATRMLYLTFSSNKDINQTVAVGHQGILDAIVKGDAGKAAQAATDDIERGYAAVRRAVLLSPALAEINVYSPAARQPA